jgi:thiol-disulfide isomerase/thioredoxin
MKKNYLLFVLLAFIYACSTQQPIKTGKEGTPIPNFSIERAENWFLNTSEIPSGKPSVFIYFKTYCPYCRAEIEDILDNIDNMKNYNFYLISIDTLPSLHDFSKEYFIGGIQNIIIGRDSTHFFSKYFNTIGVPFTAIYNKDRKLTAAFMGKISTKEIRKYSKQ